MWKSEFKHFIRFVRNPNQPGTFLQIFRKDVDNKVYCPNYYKGDSVAWWRNWNELREGEVCPSGFYIPWDIDEDIIDALYNATVEYRKHEKG